MFNLAAIDSQAYTRSTQVHGTYEDTYAVLVQWVAENRRDKRPLVCAVICDVNGETATRRFGAAALAGIVANPFPSRKR